MRLPSVKVKNSTNLRHLWHGATSILFYSHTWWLSQVVKMSWSQVSLDDVAFKRGILQSGARSCAGQPHNSVCRHAGAWIVTDPVWDDDSRKDHSKDHRLTLIITLINISLHLAGTLLYRNYYGKGGDCFRNSSALQISVCTYMRCTCNSQSTPCMFSVHFRNRAMHSPWIYIYISKCSTWATTSKCCLALCADIRYSVTLNSRYMSHYCR